MRTSLTLALCAALSWQATAQELPLPPLPPPPPVAPPATTPTQPANPKELGMEDFLKSVRSSLVNSCYVNLKGRLNWRPTDGDRERHDISFAAELQPSVMTFRSALGPAESVCMRLDFGAVYKSEVLASSLAAQNSLYTRLGIRPEDLSLSFIYWEPLKEFDRESLTVAQISCRVLLLADPDSKNYAKVWISEKYRGPVRVEWRKKLSDKDPDQVLEFKAFREVKGVWVPEEIYLMNAKGEMQVKFTELDAAFAPQAPAGLLGLPTPLAPAAGPVAPAAGPVAPAAGPVAPAAGPVAPAAKSP